MYSYCTDGLVSCQISTSQRGDSFPARPRILRCRHVITNSTFDARYHMHHLSTLPNQIYQTLA